MDREADTTTMADALLRIAAAGLFLAALAFALARYGGTEERVLNALFLMILVPALVACSRIDGSRYGTWQSVGLAGAGGFLAWRIAFVPAIEVSGHVLAALGWMGLVISLWLAQGRRLRQLLVVCVIVAGAAEAMYGFTQALGGLDRIFDYNRKLGRIATGTLINRNHYAALLNMSMGLGLGLLAAAHARARARRTPSSETLARAWLVILACGVLGLALLLSRSRGGILTLGLMAIFVGLLLFVSARIGRTSAPPPYLAALFLLVTLGLGLLVGLGSVAERFSEQPDFQRLTTYRDTVKLIADHPWTGVGAGMYGWRFQEYQTAPIDRSVQHAHNDYLELAAEWGVPVALLLVILVVRRLHRSARTFLSARDPGAQGLALGCAAATFSILVHSSIDFSLRVPANLLLFTIILGVAASLGRPAESPTGSRLPTVVLRVVICASLLVAGWRVWNLLEAQGIADRGGTIEALAQAIALEPTDPEHHARLGALYRGGSDTHDLDSSRRHLERAVELNPWDRRHHYELGRTYEALQEWELAESSLGRATAGYPAIGRHLWYLARFHLFNGDRDQMYEALGAALAADRSLLRPAVPFVVNTEASPEQIDRIWPTDPSARTELLRGIRLRGAEQRRRYLAFAIEQWTEILQGDSPPDMQAGPYFVRELLASGQVAEARRQWSALARANGLHDPEFDEGRNAIWNGGFELPFAGDPLGWQRRRVDGASLSIARSAGGSAVAAIEFSGEENIRYGGLEQLVLVSPGTYRFSFGADLDGLSTDQGLYFDFFDPVGRRSLLATERLLGTEPWREYSATLEVPPGVEQVALRLLRQPSRRIDSLIRGRLMLDNLVLTRSGD